MREIKTNGLCDEASDGFTAAAREVRPAIGTSAADSHPVLGVGSSPSPTQAERPEIKRSRRSVLAAAAIAPAIFTLPGGPALAATSIGCDANSGATARELGTSLKGLATTPDNFMRVKLQVYTAKFENMPGRIDAVTVNSRWYRVSDGTQITNLLKQSNAKSGTFVYGLVDYQNYSRSGGYTYFPAQNPVVSPIAGCSCWSSLTGTTTSSTILIA